MVYVPYIQVKLFLPGDGIATVDLCPSGDAREDFVAAKLGWIIARQVLDQQRTWADDAHLTFEDVDQFWELVQAGGTQEAAKSGEALSIWQGMALVIREMTHGSKLVDGKNTTLVAGTFLFEKNWKAMLASHQDANHQYDGC